MINTKLPFVWELIADYTLRAKVIGGWVIERKYEQKYADEHGGLPISNSITFISDPEHKWEIDNDK